MAWHTPDNISRFTFRRHGFDHIFSAGMVCLKAEQIAPAPIKAVSLSAEGVLHLKIVKRDVLALRLAEQSFIAALQAYSSAQQLPPVAKLRLTIVEHLDILLPNQT